MVNAYVTVKTSPLGLVTRVGRNPRGTGNFEKMRFFRMDFEAGNAKPQYLARFSTFQVLKVSWLRKP